MARAEISTEDSAVARPAAFPLPLLDALTEGILIGMILFSPWAFGTTQPWAMRLMNVAGYALGMLLLTKWFLRRRSGLPTPCRARAWSKLLAGVTAGILGWCLVAALNAQFTYVATEFRADTHPHVTWLPHSLDRLASWHVFWNWLALACTFWATHDWLLTDLATNGRIRTRRMRRLLFVLAINGALVALEGILQRLFGTPRLLGFQATHDNPTAHAQFGPYAYRANAAQFFNLLWPPALGLWWHMHSTATAAQRAAQRHHWLLPCVLLLVLAPLMSMSRGGMAVTLLQAVALGGVLFTVTRFRRGVRLGIVILFAVSIGLAAFLAGDEIAQRLQDTAADPLSGRGETYRLAARMAEDYPWFGVGPGAYDSVFQLYRNSPDDYWPAQLHNDWLEYRITFGRIGCALLLAAGGIIFLPWFAPGGVRFHGLFAAGLWISLGGCLLHARFDFPLQIYSIQFVFVLLCATLFSLSRSHER